jgi:uncharacterized membrane protein HdeD (DUF308 family)
MPLRSDLPADDLAVLIGINLLSSGISFLAAGFWLRRSLQ